MFDFIIVGQGLAGSLLSWFLIEKNKKVLVIDEYNPSSASHVAAGVIMPITGKRFVKTWLADQIIPFAQNTYCHFESLFNQSFFYSTSIFKIFDSVKSQNDWSLRCATPQYKAYLQNEKVVYLNNAKVVNPFGGFEVEGGARLHTANFLQHYRQYLLSKNLLIPENFSFHHLNTHNSTVTYKEHRASKIIFCEGAQAVENPYFKQLPFQLAKGECLIVQIENLDCSRILNGEVLVLPLQTKGHYYIGATHHWNFNNHLPTQAGKQELLTGLSAVTSLPVRVVEHQSAIRPTVKDRRPYIGFHPICKQVGIFNGLGTKGISLAPYFAHHFAQYLCDGAPLNSEVSIERFLS